MACFTRQTIQLPSDGFSKPNSPPTQPRGVQFSIGSAVALGVHPRSLIVRHPVPYGPELRRDEAIAAFSTVPLLGHEAGIEQDAEVLRDGRLIWKCAASALAERAVSMRRSSIRRRAGWLIAAKTSGSRLGITTMQPIYVSDCLRVKLN